MPLQIRLERHRLAFAERQRLLQHNGKERP